MERLSQNWKLFYARRRSPDAILRVQRQRLANIVDYAKNHSPYYQRLYRHIPPPATDLLHLPPVTKPGLMASFDEWVTDPRVSLKGVQQFLYGQIRPGQSFLGRYSVWRTSGTSGEPGIFLHDPQAQSLYNDLLLFRAYPGWLSLRQMFDLLRRGFRYALVIATSGPFAAISSWELVRQRLGRFGNVLTTLSIDDPLPELIRQLNELQPLVLASYPSALVLLAGEQARGNLRIRPAMLACTSEWLAPAARPTIEKAFAPARLVEIYGSSEFPYIATSCRYNWLHVNADWVILEPVDRENQPILPGQPSHSVLLTNLANRIQPVIRYNLGDSVTFCPHPCPCGSQLPALLVEGRQDDILTLSAEDGKPVQLLPRSLASRLEILPGVRRFQIIQIRPNALQVRLEPVSGSDPQQVWAGVAEALTGLLKQHGLSGVCLQLSSELPHPDPVSGKFREVWSEIKEQGAES